MRFRTAIVVLVALLASAVPATGSGGTSDCDYMACYSFFMPDAMAGEVAFFFRGPTFNRDGLQAPGLNDINIEEWERYFRGRIPRHELYTLIYSAAIDDLNAENLRQYGDLSRMRQFVRYLTLAKRVEPIAMADADRSWNSPPRRIPDPALIRELIDTAERQLRGTDRFLTQRYRLQVIRLMYYGGLFDEAQRYFQRHKGIFTEENSPKYRFIDAAAGAYYKQKKFGQANYLFSLVFDKFAPLRLPAYRSFRPMEDADWRETLSLARNTREREVLWQLLGIRADGIAAIEAIHALNPKSDLLPLLLAREVNQIEAAWSSNNDRLRYFDPNGPDAARPPSDVVGPRLTRIKRIADEGKAAKPYLWQLAAGHLMALSGDVSSAERYIQEALRSMPDDFLLRAQARMSLLLARVQAIQTIDKSAEPFFARELAWLQDDMGGSPRSTQNYRARTLNLHVLNRLSRIYRAGGDPMRALLMEDSPSSEDYRSVKGVDAILEFVGQATTEFDRFLVSNYQYPVSALQELRANSLLYEGDFAGAAEAYRLSGVGSRPLNADPFTARLRDCHQCDREAPHTTYNRIEFAERMLELSITAQGSGQAAAEASFELANGLYNMSYFGNSRDLIHWNLSPRVENGPPSSSPAMRMDLAESYYIRAVALSADREFKARAVFMAAKASQNREFNTGNRTGNYGHPSHHFRTLSASYSDTKYFDEIIKECGYFRTFMGLN